MPQICDRRTDHSAPHHEQTRILASFGDDRASIRSFGLDVVTDMCDRMLTQGAPGIHFYTLNMAGLTTTLWQRLGL